jgi:hypothetical protein
MFHTFLKLLHGISQIKSGQAYYVSFSMFLCVPMLLQSHNQFLNKLWNITEKIYHLCDIRLIPLLKMWRNFFSSHIINLVYRGLNTTRWRTTQKVTHGIQNTAKAWNHECLYIFVVWHLSLLYLPLYGWEFFLNHHSKNRNYSTMTQNYISSVNRANGSVSAVHRCFKKLTYLVQ